jgi:hypothetical protein
MISTLAASIIETIGRAVTPVLGSLPRRRTQNAVRRGMTTL